MLPNGLTVGSWHRCALHEVEGPGVLRHEGGVGVGVGRGVVVRLATGTACVV